MPEPRVPREMAEALASPSTQAEEQYLLECDSFHIILKNEVSLLG